MNIIFFDDANRDHLLPLTFTRPSAKLRCGILNLEEKWLKRLPDNLAYSYLTEDYLAKKFPLVETDTNLYINPAVCPTQQLMDAVLSLGASETLMKGEIIIASRTKAALLDANEQDTEVLDFEGDFNYISRPYHLFQYNGAELELDYKLLTDGRHSASISETNTIIGDDVFVEEGA
ncbi:MAG: putative sugar nucleotidyl transferase, partial [Croceimicrobium sp.]